MVISKAKSAARTCRNWVRARQWEFNIQNKSLPFSPSIGKSLGRPAGGGKGARSFGGFIYNTTNIGDDIQTVAQLGFIPKNRRVKAVRRDHLSEYKNGGATCIMNGWFSHHPENWPPSSRIDPIFVSFHAAKEEIVAEEHKGYYRKYEPIGCRDYATVEKLERIGIEAYFSGCLTLTLENPYDEEDRTGDVVIADTHLRNGEEYPPSAPKLLERLVPERVRRDAKRVEHEVGLERKYNYTWKMNRALELLKLYARAKLVITSRMHCALPCIALNTPVVLLHKQWNEDMRFDGYREMLRGYGPESKRIDIDWEDPSPMGKTGLEEELREDVRSRVEEKMRQYG